MRPLGRGIRFHPPATGPVIGRCKPSLGPRVGVHLEVFAQNRVVLVPAGLGARRPWRFSAGRIAGAKCYGDLVTLEPTGVLLMRPGARLRLPDVFRAWGEPLTREQLSSFLAPSGRTVRAFVNGRSWRGRLTELALTPRAVIVIEVGAYVAPHSSYTFPPGS